VTVFALASFVAWYSWTQLYVPQYFPAWAYRPPWYAIAIAVATILGLVALALRSGEVSRPLTEIAQSRPVVWQIGTVAFLFTLPWFTLVFLSYGMLPTLPAIVPMVAGLTWIGTAFHLVRHMTKWRQWQTATLLAVIPGLLLASMLTGYAILWASSAPVIDYVGKLLFDGLAVLGLCRLFQTLRRASEDDHNLSKVNLDEVRDRA
jgi:hypothetical protein